MSAPGSTVGLTDATVADGLVAVVKRDCPTCTLVVPVLRDLAARGALRVYTQDDPTFPEGVVAADDTSLDVSFALEIDTVPTLLRLEGGEVIGRTEGWSRERWEALTGFTDLGTDLPDFRPGCGSRTHDPDIADARAITAMTPLIRSRRLELGASEDEQEAMFARGWTDGLPVVAPTIERVARMLAGTTRAPDDMVAVIPPDLVECTVEKVAVNAVMAGADPSHFPVILALAASGDTGRQSSMSSMGNMVVVNGPIRNEIGMNSGIGALGPYNYANSAIGRAFGLLSQNLQGGSVPGISYNGSQGCNFSYNSCTFAENEEASPWEPYHVQHGYSREDSTVTVSYVWGNVWSEHLRTYWPEKLQAMLCGLEPSMGMTLALDPIVAREFVERGFDTKEKVIDWIYENARIPARRYWDHIMLNMIREVVEAGVEPFASYSKAPPDELIPMFEPDRINIVVVGGATNGQFNVFMGGPMRGKFRSGGARQATISVDAWR